MRILVILGHQRPGSFCHAIATAAVEQLRAGGHQVVFHDLYEERFDPILSETEIPKGAPLGPVLRQHCREVSEAEGYVVVHPNWWGQPPAILKGWIDRVLRQGVAYEFAPEGVVGKLAGRRAAVFTTSNTPRDEELRLFGDPLENLWKTCVFGFCGIGEFARRNFEPVILSTPEQRAAWLEEVRCVVREHFGDADGPAKPRAAPIPNP
ncbi:MAG: NAD(P)H-dependent oxidoreductase [Thermoguttaceae bacterium]|jgi:putative NADPH-quinone reductase